MALAQQNSVFLVDQAARGAPPISASRADPKAQAKILDSYGKLPLIYFRLEDQVPANHLLRLIDEHISFALVREKLLPKTENRFGGFLRAYKKRLPLEVPPKKSFCSPQLPARNTFQFTQN